MFLGNASVNKLGRHETGIKYAKVEKVNPGSSHAKAAAQVKPGSTVLDLGCSTGLIGEYLKKNKGCKMYGVDIDAQLIKQAKRRKVYEKIEQINLDFESSNENSLPFQKNFFDAIILSDVIEHLKHPENLLKILPQYLRDNGCVILSLPNIGHQDIILNLLDGKFNYDDLGLLDTTHIRFFTDKSFFEFINNINDDLSGRFFKCSIVDSIIAEDEDSNFQNADFLNLTKISGMSVLQYIIKLSIVAKKPKNTVAYTNKFSKNTENIFARLKRQEFEQQDSESIRFHSEALDFYRNKNNEKLAIISELKKQLHWVTEELSTYRRFDHPIYRIGTTTIKAVRRIAPPDTIRRKILFGGKKIIKYALKAMRKIFRLVANGILFIIPSKSFKIKCKNRMHTSRALAKIFGLPYNGLLPQRAAIMNDGTEIALTNLEYLDKTIAVHLHLYYTDLTKEFKQYLSNIPYKFDLYVSISKHANSLITKARFKSITNLNKIVVKHSRNCGRDFGPMFVLFGKDLKKYDYILHIHSKKSLRMGAEQSEWRRHLLNGVLGTRETIMQTFDLLRYRNVKLVYPEVHRDCTYIAHTYLGAFCGKASEIYNKLGLKYEDTYLNFSAGSMFWCDKKLLKEVFDLNLTWEDFGEDTGQHDGSLEYLMERIFDPLIKKYGYNFATLNFEDNKFHINYSDKNLQQYRCVTPEWTIDNLSKYKVISFDIFDTLVCRKIYSPDDVFKITDKNVSAKYKFKDGQFYSSRKKAEANVRANKNYIGDCTIDEIYEEFAKLNKISEKQAHEIKELEFKNDLKFMEPREDMLLIYNNLLAKNKKIILVSDMYYTKTEIDRILAKCGYKKYDKLYVSSEIGCRKDNGTMWKFIYDKYDNIIHVGDNEESDIHLLIAQNKPYHHVMMGRKMYESSKYFASSNDDIENSIMKGLIINKSMFNSPFAFNAQRDGGPIDSLEKYGYSILGPILLKFCIWLINNANKDETLLFVSREGHYLQKIYQHVLSKDKTARKNKNLYFLTSRRALSVANIENIDDVRSIFDTPYEGSIKELFYYRLGIILGSQYQNRTISLPKDLKLVLNVAEENMALIRQNAKQEKQAYLKYIKSTIKNKNEKLCIVDIGYSGSAQYELCRLLGEQINGAYFITETDFKPEKLGASGSGCYNAVAPGGGFKNSILAHNGNNMILESFLTAPQGQLTKFDENGQPIYQHNENKLSIMPKLDKVYDGIIEFINDMAELNDDNLCSLNLDAEYVLKNLDLFRMYTPKLNTEISKTLKVEDYYISGKVVNYGDGGKNEV